MNGLLGAFGYLRINGGGKCPPGILCGSSTAGDRSALNWRKAEHYRNWSRDTTSVLLSWNPIEFGMHELKFSFMSTFVTKRHGTRFLWYWWPTISRFEIKLMTSNLRRSMAFICMLCISKKIPIDSFQKCFGDFV